MFTILYMCILECVYLSCNVLKIHLYFVNIHSPPVREPSCMLNRAVVEIAIVGAHFLRDILCISIIILHTAAKFVLSAINRFKTGFLLFVVFTNRIYDHRVHFFSFFLLYIYIYIYIYIFLRKQRLHGN